MTETFKLDNDGQKVIEKAFDRSYRSLLICQVSNLKWAIMHKIARTEHGRKITEGGKLINSLKRIT